MIFFNVNRWRVAWSILYHQSKDSQTATFLRNCLVTVRMSQLAVRNPQSKSVAFPIPFDNKGGALWAWTELL